MDYAWEDDETRWQKAVGYYEPFKVEKPLKAPLSPDLDNWEDEPDGDD